MLLEKFRNATDQDEIWKRSGVQTLESRLLWYGLDILMEYLLSN